MKKQWICLAAGAFTLLLPQIALAAVNLSGTSCSELATRCKASTEMYSEDLFCGKALNSTLKTHSGICIPPSKKSTLSEIEKDFIQWSDKHPEAMTQTAEDCLMVWLDESYSCR